MQVIIDERETALYDKCVSISNPKITVIKQVLLIGDILIKTEDGTEIALIERKSFSDLLSSIKDGRYEEQSYRLINTCKLPLHSVIYLIEGMFSQLRNPADKRVIYSAMTSLQFFKGFSIQRTSSVNESAEWLMSFADKICRDLAKGKVPHYLAAATEGEPETSQHTSANYCSVVKKVKKDNITPENIGEIILCQIPGISSVTAIAIMKHFPNFPTFIEELKNNPQCLENIVCENSGKPRKISKSCLESIRRFLLLPVVSENILSGNDLNP